MNPVCANRTHAHSHKRAHTHKQPGEKHTYRALRVEQTASSRAAAGEVLLRGSSLTAALPEQRHRQRRQRQHTQPSAAPCCAASRPTEARNRRGAHNPADHGRLQTNLQNPMSVGRRGGRRGGAGTNIGRPVTPVRRMMKRRKKGEERAETTSPLQQI